MLSGQEIIFHINPVYMVLLKSTGIWSTYLICIFLLSTHNKFLRVVIHSIKLNWHKIIYI